MALTDIFTDDDCELNDDCGLIDLECEKTFVDCICPKCQARHKMKLCWTGAGIPRKFCNACRKSAHSYEMDEVFTLNTDSD